MTTTSYFDRILILQVAIGCMFFWLGWRGETDILGSWRLFAVIAAVVAGVGLCVTCPTIPLGAAIIGAYGWVSYPRQAVAK